MTRVKFVYQNPASPYEKIRDLLAFELRDGEAIEASKITGICDELALAFGAITISPLSAPHQGRWKYGGVEYIDQIIKVEILAAGDNVTKKFLKAFKERLKKDLRQVDILITTHGIQVI